jgi:hypothetical protein
VNLQSGKYYFHPSCSFIFFDPDMTFSLSFLLWAERKGIYWQSAEKTSESIGCEKRRTIQELEIAGRKDKLLMKTIREPDLNRIQ